MTANKREIEKAKADLQEVKQAAKEQLSAMPTVHKFEMVGECEDQDGNLTRVLEIDTDAEGVLGLFMEVGQPFSFSLDPSVSADDRVKKDAKKFGLYLQAMANVDLADKAVLKAVGWDALAKARETVDGFFMLRLVSATSLGETAE